MKIILTINFSQNISQEEYYEVVNNVGAALIRQVNNSELAPEDSDAFTESFELEITEPPFNRFYYQM